MNVTDTKQTVVVTPSGETYTKSIQLVREYDLRIDINGEEHITISCTAVMLQELVAGRLLTDGYINSKNDIISLNDALISKTVPTTQAVMLANEKGITLIGKAWPDGYEIF